MVIDFPLARLISSDVYDYEWRPHRPLRPKQHFDFCGLDSYGTLSDP